MNGRSKSNLQLSEAVQKIGQNIIRSLIWFLHKKYFIFQHKDRLFWQCKCEFNCLYIFFKHVSIHVCVCVQVYMCVRYCIQQRSLQVSKIFSNSRKITHQTKNKELCIFLWRKMYVFIKILKKSSYTLYHRQLCIFISCMIKKVINFTHWFRSNINKRKKSIVPIWSNTIKKENGMVTLSRNGYISDNLINQKHKPKQ